MLSSQTQTIDKVTKKKFIDIIFNFSRHIILFFIVLATARIYELIFLTVFKPGFTGNISLYFSSLSNDAFLCGVVVAFLIIPYFITAFFSNRISLLLLRASLLFWLFITLVFTQYFLTNYGMLNSIIFSMSLNKLTTIAAAEFTTDRIWLWLQYLIFLPLLLLLITKLDKKLNHIVSNLISLTLIVVLLVGTTINRKHILLKSKDFNNLISYFYANNKLLYFAYDFYEQQVFQQSLEGDIKQHVLEYYSYHRYFHYTTLSSPYEHFSLEENALQPFFNFKETPPNVVIIIVESLSRTFSGNNSRIHSLTPFLDSLAQNGLCWDNFLSTTERSFGVLTSINGSLPFGPQQNGIINMPEDSLQYPKHFSLVEFFNNNGYSTTFHYGGWSSFDYMKQYLSFCGIHKVTEMFDINPDIYGALGNNDWGYNDKQMFRYAMDYQTYKYKGLPFFNIYFTLSMHTPFNMVEEKYKEEEYINQRIEELGVEPETLYQQISKEIIAATFFTEDALKEYFENVKKNFNYDNTIFIITGDHRITGEVLERQTPLEAYHVPLIIFSPLLNCSKRFPAVSTHRDIAPSLYNLLATQFNFNKPLKSAWLGQGLDTSSVFRNRNSTEMALYGDYSAMYLHFNHLITKNGVFSLQENLLVKEENDEEVKILMKKILNNSKIMNGNIGKKILNF